MASARMAATSRSPLSVRASSLPGLGMSGCGGVGGRSCAKLSGVLVVVVPDVTFVFDDDDTVVFVAAAACRGG